MITLQTLTIDRFICIDHTDIDFSNNYITIFAGPNGAGKSTVLEAISLCWTGRKRGDSYVDFIMRGQTSSTIHHTAIFRGEPIQFDVELINKKGTAPFQRVIKYKNETYTNSECTDLLNSLDIDYLQQAMFFMQDDDDITRLRPAERTKLLKRVFSFEFNSQLSQLSKLIEQEEQNILVLKTRLDVFSHLPFIYEEEQKETLTPQESIDINSRILEIQNILQAKEQQRLLHSEKTRYLDGLNSQYKDLIKRKEDINKELRISKNSRDQLVLNRNDHTASLASLPDLTKIKEEIQAKTDLITSLNSLVTTNQKLIQEKTDNLSIYQKSIFELKNHIEAHKEGICPKCGQNTQPSSVPTLEQELVKITTTYNEISSQQTRLKIDERATEKIIITHQTEISGLREKITTTTAMKDQLEKILKTIEENLNRLDQAIQNTEKSLDTLDYQITEVKQQIDREVTDPQDTEDINSLQNEKTKLEEDLQINLSIISKNKEIVLKNIETEKKEKENKQTIFDLEQQQNKLLLSLSMYKEAYHILEIDLPNYIIVKACSKLEESINTFLSKVKPGMIVRLFQARSGVEFQYSPTDIITSNEDWMSTKMSSGFEKELLAVAWRISLAQSYNLPILLLDEVDSAAFPSTSEKMFREIANLSDFKQLIIITQKLEIIDIFKQENDYVTSYLVEDGTFNRQEY